MNLAQWSGEDVENVEGLQIDILRYGRDTKCEQKSLLSFNSGEIESTSIYSRIQLSRIKI